MGSGHMTNRGFHGGSYAPAHYLKQFHPKYTAQADIDAHGHRGGRRGLDRPLPAQEPVVAQPGPADPRPLAHRLAGQHPELDDGAQPLLLRGRPRGEPAPLPRRHPDDAGREPGGAQPARHRRRVRPAGAPHRHRQAAGLPGEHGAGRLQRPPRPRRLRLRRHAPDQPQLRRRPRDRQVAAERRLPPRALDGDRPRPAQRDLLARRRLARQRRAGPGRRRRAPAKSGAPSGRRSTSSRPTSSSTRSA